jgi:hypothetical protein
MTHRDAKAIEASERERLQSSPFLRQFYPRRITTPAGYSNPIIYSLLSLVNYRRGIDARARGEMTDRGANVIRSEWTIANKAVDMRFPTYFVSEPFIRAVAATRPPDDMTIAEIEWPLDFMLFCFPHRFMREYLEGWRVQFLAVAHLKQGENKMPLSTIDCESEMFFAHYPLHRDNGAIIDYTSWSGAKERVSVFAKVDLLQCDESPDAIQEWNKIAGEAPSPDEKQERMITERMTSLAMRLLLTLTAEPEHCDPIPTAPDRPQRVKRGMVVREELWHPLWVGKRYQPHREWLGGTHASPRMHWRVGHHHTYLVGKGRTQRKLKWVKPVLVCAAQDNNITTKGNE